jgi:hypothetical protein
VDSSDRVVHDWVDEVPVVAVRGTVVPPIMTSPPPVSRETVCVPTVIIPPGVRVVEPIWKPVGSAVTVRLPIVKISSV